MVETSVGRPAGAGGEQRMRVARPPIQRFAENVKFEPNGCWGWLGYGKGKGYSGFWTGRKTIYAHRWSYETFVGPIPDGMHIDHVCRHRTCVNPCHLRIVTPRQNALENSVGLAAANTVKTHCIRSHAYTDENTMMEKLANGRMSRRCRVCHREIDRQYRLRKKSCAREGRVAV